MHDGIVTHGNALADGDGAIVVDVQHGVVLHVTVAAMVLESTSAHTEAPNHTEVFSARWISPESIALSAINVAFSTSGRMPLTSIIMKCFLAFGMMRCGMAQGAAAQALAWCAMRTHGDVGRELPIEEENEYTGMTADEMQRLLDAEAEQGASELEAYRKLMRTLGVEFPSKE